jgi:transposase
MARPTQFSHATEKAILLALRTGNTETAAAAYAGISTETLRRWKRRYVTFREAVTKAQTEAQMLAVGRVRAAMADHWQAAAWWLERRHPAEWSKQVNVMVTLREEALRLAAERGLDEAEALAAAEAVLAEARA